MPAHPLLPDVIDALHSDLAEWMGTNAAPKVFDRFANALHEDFSAVTTTGQVFDRDALLAGVWSARNTQPDLTIEITEVQEIATGASIVVARFTAVNRQAHPSPDHHPSSNRSAMPAELYSRRLVTAVLDVADHGYQWRSVHETAAAAPE
ncbi:DUF4440 domain-containing protein [Nocardia altamirensis]|uniref:DUF4440 domain-containing protein n=1 Tax=Nocardia altamirensis TaxID=472158 RepID=UPI0008406E7F|nr:DUF4440 domain-containing protein [Nocardia altamirensis]